MKLMILGGGSCQKSAFRMAQRRGIETALLDYLPHPPCAELAGEHVQASTFDRAACLAAARRLRPDGVMTLGTDQPVYTAAYVAHRRGLPSLLSPSTALAVTNKALMKRILTDHGIPTAPYRLVDRDTVGEVWTASPMVLKPLDSQGQKGVFRVESAAEAKGLFDQSAAFSRCQKLLLEEYYPSREVTVSAWVDKGVPRILTVTDRITFRHRRHIGVCAAHRFPSHYARGQEDAVAGLVHRITKAFAIPAGPLYIQLLLGERGILVNELACRIGGAFEDVFIPYLTGFDILAAVMDCTLGLPPPPPPQREAAGSARVLMPFARSGLLRQLTPVAQLAALPGMLAAGYNFRRGDSLPVFENAGARLGYFVLGAKDEAEMEQRQAALFQALRVAGDEGQDLLLRGENELF